MPSHKRFRPETVTDEVLDALPTSERHCVDVRDVAPLCFMVSHLSIPSCRAVCSSLQAMAYINYAAACHKCVLLASPHTAVHIAALTASWPRPSYSPSCNRRVCDQDGVSSAVSRYGASKRRRWVVRNARGALLSVLEPSSLLQNTRPTCTARHVEPCSCSEPGALPSFIVQYRSNPLAHRRSLRPSCLSTRQSTRVHLA